MKINQQSRQNIGVSILEMKKMPKNVQPQNTPHKL